MAFENCTIVPTNFGLGAASGRTFRSDVRRSALIEVPRGFGSGAVKRCIESPRLDAAAHRHGVPASLSRPTPLQSNFWRPAFAGGDFGESKWASLCEKDRFHLSHQRFEIFGAEGLFFVGERFVGARVGLDHETVCARGDCGQG